MNTDTLNLEELIVDVLVYLRPDGHNPFRLARKLAHYWRKKMASDREQEAALNEKLTGLTGAVASVQSASDAILAVVSTLGTTVTDLQAAVTDIQAKLEAALVDTVDLTDESAAIDAAKTQLDSIATALSAASQPTPTP